MDFVIAGWLSSRVRVILLEIVVLPVGIRHITVIGICIVVVGVCSGSSGCVWCQTTPPKPPPMSSTTDLLPPLSGLNVYLICHIKSWVQIPRSLGTNFLVFCADQ